MTVHPNLNFTVIINPENGPGNSSYPGDDYAPQIQSLNAYSNVRTVGYVRTNYARRNISAVIDDVATYAGWGKNQSANTNSSAPLAVDGIFFDEAPYDYTEDVGKYMETINEAAKNTSGFLPDRIVSTDKYYPFVHQALHGNTIFGVFSSSLTRASISYRETYRFCLVCSAALTSYSGHPQSWYDSGRTTRQPQYRHHRDFRRPISEL